VNSILSGFIVEFGVSGTFQEMPGASVEAEAGALTDATSRGERQGIRFGCSPCTGVLVAPTPLVKEQDATQVWSKASIAMLSSATMSTVSVKTLFLQVR